MLINRLEQYAEILELVATRDDLGGSKQEWNSIGSSPCLIQPAQGGVERDEAKDGSAATHMIILPGSWDLSAANQIVAGAKRYNVVACRDWNSMGNKHRNGHTTVSAIVETS